MALDRVKLPLLQLKFEVRSLLAREPVLKPLYQPFVWWAKHKAIGHIDPSECAIGADTEFVIDGFQGSGNSFATVAFKRSQPRPVKLAHHLHSPAQIIQAVEADVPVLITLREPRGAAVSLVSRWPYVTLRQAVRGYIHFYEKLLPVAPHCAISTFELTTRHLDHVIETVNRRFDRDFGVFSYSDENMHALRNPEQLSSGAELKRKEMKEARKAALREPKYQHLLARADEIYERIAAFGIAMPETTPSPDAGA